ncbi:MAG: hypothetical protein P1P64_03265 [Treponemataceae bacterium]
MYGDKSYIDIIFEAYKENTIGDIHINKYQLHSLLFYITYMLQTANGNFEEFPYPSELTKDFGTKKGISFAFMNLSKFSNETGNWEQNKSLIDSFVSASKEFIAKEIEILQPDVIITMNIMNYLEDILDIELIDNSNCDAWLYKTKLGNSEVHLIDTWHFSYPSKSRKKNFVEPVFELVKKIGLV